MNLRNEAENYVPIETKNIAELKRVPVDINIEEETYTDAEGKDFTIKVIEVEGEKYRVPVSVIKQLKVQLEKRPSLQFFSVGKSGENLKTSYTVIPLDDKE